MVVCMCEIASDEHECVQTRGCVDVPPYNAVHSGSVSEDWDSGIFTSVIFAPSKHDINF